ncbi:hypothetical protein AB7M74_004031 [Bradyrhizobium japonicum]
MWTFIWSLLGTLKLRNLSFLGSEQMDNLLRDQTWPTANENSIAVILSVTATFPLPDIWLMYAWPTCGG